MNFRASASVGSAPKAAQQSGNRASHRTLRLYASASWYSLCSSCSFVFKKLASSLVHECRSRPRLGPELILMNLDGSPVSFRADHSPARNQLQRDLAIQLGRPTDGK